MVVSDLNIVCIGQNAAQKVACDGIGIDILENHDGYGDHWKALKKCRGIWYQFFPLEEITTHQYNDEFFDCKFEGDSCFVIANSKHLADIESIIKANIVSSPVNEILLLIRLDEHGESENQVNIGYSEFIEKLYAGAIRFNTIYRVYQ